MQIDRQIETETGN